MKGASASLTLLLKVSPEAYAKENHQRRERTSIRRKVSALCEDHASILIPTISDYSVERRAVFSYGRKLYERAQ